MLDELLDNLRRETAESRWRGARYEWLTSLSPVELGSVGAQLYVDARGGRVMGREATYDVEHDDKLIEAKIALRSHQSKGKQFRYQWSALRQADTWTHAWLVAVNYSTVRAFLVPRGAIDTKAGKGDGLQAYWVGNSDAHDGTLPPDWLAQHEVTLRPAR